MCVRGSLGLHTKKIIAGGVPASRGRQRFHVAQPIDRAGGKRKLDKQPANNVLSAGQRFFPRKPFNVETLDVRVQGSKYA
jgi:hypothetical protein